MNGNELTQKHQCLFPVDPDLCLSVVILVLLNQILPSTPLDQPPLTKQHSLLMDLRINTPNQHFIDFSLNEDMGLLKGFCLK